MSAPALPPAPGGDEDLGLAAIAALRETWQVEPDCSAGIERGFAWWPGNFRQRVWAEPGVEDEGFRLWRLNAVTDFARGIALGEAQAARRIGLFARFASGYAWVHEPAGRALRLWSSAWIHAEVAADVLASFAQLAPLQVADAELRAAEFARVLEGDPDRSACPGAPERPAGHPALGAAKAIARRGRGRSSWGARAGFERFAQELRRRRIYANGDVTGLAAEPAFGGEDTALVVLDARERHPQLGRGLAYAREALAAVPLEAYEERR